MDDHLSGSNASWRSVALCCRYSLVRFERLPVPSEQVDVAPFGNNVLWALGVLSDGQYEVLGAWPVPEPPTTEWVEVFEDLRARGVERIGAVIGGDLDMDPVAVRMVYPGAASLVVSAAATPVARTHTKLSQGVATAGLRSRPSGRVPLHQRLAQASNDAVRRMQTSALLAIARHGPFRKFEAAQSFAIDKLRYAERKLARSPLDACASASPVSARPP